MLFVAFLIAQLSFPARLAEAAVLHISASAALAIIASELAVFTEVARRATLDQYTSQQVGLCIQVAPYDRAIIIFF